MKKVFYEWLAPNGVNWKKKRELYFRLKTLSKEEITEEVRNLYNGEKILNLLVEYMYEEFNNETYDIKKIDITFEQLSQFFSIKKTNEQMIEQIKIRIEFNERKIKELEEEINETISIGNNNNIKDLEEKLEKTKLILNKHKMNLKKYESGE